MNKLNILANPGGMEGLMLCLRNAIPINDLDIDLMGPVYEQ
jgi:hypothetical protein